MAAVDRDTFIPIGTSIVKLLLIASGQGTLATAVGEGAGLLAKLRGTLEIGGKRAVFAEKIADDAAEQLLREYQGISEADWGVAARLVASLIDRLPEKERLAAGYNWEELRRTLLDLGGTDLRSSLADESARQAFDWVLEVACQRIADCFTEKEALASILESVEEVRAGIQRLADRPAGASQTRAVVTDHLEVVRDLAPDPLEDREREIAELEAFVRGSEKVWYAIEAGMVSGKTGLMSAFALNPPHDAHIVSFFIRRYGGDGNDWRSFAFIVGAQLAEILGDEYTERVSEPASQNTEFRQLLRRAASACQSEKNPRPLVLVIDGVDEDSYYERPDDAAAKSILSLLPRHLPEGVKVVTASRPNPRPPDDIVCDSPKKVVSLNASRIAQKKINQNDMECFFSSDIAVEVAAFLAGCGGYLTVNDLRILISRRRHGENVTTAEINKCVSRSPGRMLLPVKVGFAVRKIFAYGIGHDAVTHALIREIAPERFGEGDEPESEVWWARTRKEVLQPYRDVICEWVEERFNGGWGETTPSYMLTESCFDLMSGNAQHWESSVRIILDQGRYKEMLRRNNLCSRVVKRIDDECAKIINLVGETISQHVMKSLHQALHFKDNITHRSPYPDGLLRLCVSHLDLKLDDAIDMVLNIDGTRNQFEAIKEVVVAAAVSGKESSYQSFLLEMMKHLNLRDEARDRFLSMLIDVLLAVKHRVFLSADCCCGGSLAPEVRLMKNALHCFQIETNSRGHKQTSMHTCSANCRQRAAESLFDLMKNVAESIADPRIYISAMLESVSLLSRLGRKDELKSMTQELVVATEMIVESRDREISLVDIVRALSESDEIEQASNVVRQIRSAEYRSDGMNYIADSLLRMNRNSEALMLSRSIESPLPCVRALTSIAITLSQNGDVGWAQQISQEAVGVAEAIDDYRLRNHCLFSVADRLAIGGRVEEALVVAKKIDNDSERSIVLVNVVGELVRSKNTTEALDVARNVEEPLSRVHALGSIAITLSQNGDVGWAQQISQEAVGVAEAIGDVWTQCGGYAHIASVLARIGQTAQALDISDRIKDRCYKESVLVDIVKALVVEERNEEALNVVEKIGESALRARALTNVADGLARSGHLDRSRQIAEDATELIERVSDSGGHARALREIVSALAREGLIEIALKVADRIEEPILLAQGLQAIVVKLAQERRTKEALMVAEGIGESEMRAQALIRVSDILAQTGCLKWAMRIAHEVWNLVEQFEDLGMRVRVLSEIVEVKVRAGGAIRTQKEVDEAVKITRRIKERYARVLSQEKAVAALAISGRLTEAFEFADEISDHTSRDSAFSSAALALARLGTGDGVINIIERIEDPGECARALLDVMGEVHVDDVVHVLRVVGKMQEAADDPANRSAREYLLSLVANVLFQCGRDRESLAVVAKIEDLNVRVRTLADIVVVLVRQKCVAQACRVALIIKNYEGRVDDPAVSSWGLSNAVVSLVEVDQIERARDIVELTVEDRAWARGQVAIIKGLVRRNLFGEAGDLLSDAFDRSTHFVQWQDAADYWATFAQGCCDVAGVDGLDSDMRFRWVGLGRAAFSRAWIYGAPFWDHFDILMCVAPELAVQLVEERILGAPKTGTASESEPDLGVEGPGGDAGSYR